MPSENAGKPIAVGLMSGGLDSSLAVALVKEQGCDVVGVFVWTPFLARGGVPALSAVRAQAEELSVDLEVVEAGEEYFDLVLSPRFGYGRHMNPCVDCHIYMLKAAGSVMERLGGLFVFTGEVLNQRGMSQTLPSLMKVEKESGLGGRLVRPLSAAWLPPSEPEQKGILDRRRLLGIKGRQRTVQLAEAAARGLTHYTAPAGGCLLTDDGFSRRLRNYLEIGERLDVSTCALLQTGRYFRIGPSTLVIVPRNSAEQEVLCRVARSTDFLVWQDGVPLPVALVRGVLSDRCLEVVAAYCRDHQPLLVVRSAAGVEVCRRMVARREKSVFSSELVG